MSNQTDITQFRTKKGIELEFDGIELKEDQTLKIKIEFASDENYCHQAEDNEEQEDEYDEEDEVNYPLFMKKLTPSKDLSLIVGSNTLPRTEAIRRLWS